MLDARCWIHDPPARPFSLSPLLPRSSAPQKFRLEWTSLEDRRNGPCDIRNRQATASAGARARTRGRPHGAADDGGIAIRRHPLRRPCPGRAPPSPASSPTPRRRGHRGQHAARGSADRRGSSVLAVGSAAARSATRVARRRATIVGQGGGGDRNHRPARQRRLPGNRSGGPLPAAAATQLVLPARSSDNFW